MGRATNSVKRIARYLGVFVSRHPPPDSLAFNLWMVFSRLGINCVLDVGAHTGGYAKLLRQDVRFKGQIISFEPATQSFRRLSEARRNDRRWRGYRYALARRPGTAELTVFADSKFSSFLPPSSFGTNRYSDHFEAPATELVEVRALSEVFDDVTRHIEDPRVHLKIDAQGFDMEIIEGAVPILGKIVSMQTEVSMKPIYEGQPVMAETLGRLRELGFEVAGLFPVAKEADRLRVIEFDCVLVRGDQRRHHRNSS
jgi:FkbM family methyltransferase